MTMNDNNKPDREDERLRDEAWLKASLYDPMRAGPTNGLTNETFYGRDARRLVEEARTTPPSKKPHP